MQKRFLSKFAFAAVLVLVALLCLPIACTRQSAQDPAPDEAAAGTDAAARVAATTNTTFTCGSTISDTYTAGSSSYTYSDKLIDLASVAQGATVSVSVNASEYPNRFEIRDASGVVVASSNSLQSCTNGWIGSSTYVGPWAPSCPNTGPPCSVVSSNNCGLIGISTGTLTFTKGAGNSYYLRVQTALPSNAAGQQDSWFATVSCPAPPGPAPCTGCKGTVDGTYTGFGYYTYPARTITIPACIANGTRISVSVSSSEYPNRFIIKDASGNTVASSNTLQSCTNGWIGYSTYSGPWGCTSTNCAPISIVNNQCQMNGIGTGTLSFTKATSTYTVVVETFLPTQSTSNPTPRQDSWYAMWSAAGCP